MAELRPSGPPCESKHPTCTNVSSWVVTDPENDRESYLCAGHADLYRKWPNPWPAVEFECIDMAVVEVEDDGTRVVRVYVKWGDEVRTSDVRFDRETWENAGGQ